jgi:hypothetical protein
MHGWAPVSSLCVFPAGGGLWVAQGEADVRGSLTSQGTTAGGFAFRSVKGAGLPTCILKLLAHARRGQGRASVMELVLILFAEVPDHSRS